MIQPYNCQEKLDAGHSLGWKGWLTHSRDKAYCNLLMWDQWLTTRHFTGLSIHDLTPTTIPRQPCPAVNSYISILFLFLHFSPSFHFFPFRFFESLFILCSLIFSHLFLIYVIFTFFLFSLFLSNFLFFISVFSIFSFTFIFPSLFHFLFCFQFFSSLSIFFVFCFVLPVIFTITYNLWSSYQV